MPKSDNNEFGLTSLNSSASISGVPIKKRLFRLSQCSYPMSEEPDLPPPDCGSLKMSSCLEQESTISDNSTDLVLHSDISVQSVSVSSSFGTASIHESLSQASAQEFGQKYATTSGQVCSTAGITMRDKSFGSSVMDNGKLMSTLNIPPEPHVGEVDIGYLANSGWQLTLSSDAKNHGCNLIDPANGGNRLNLDLNIPVDMWDATVNESVSEDSMSEMLNDVDKYQKNHEVCPLQTIPLKISGTEVMRDKSIIGKSHNDLRLSNLEKPTDKHKESELGLDLQLKPPSIPELSVKCRSFAPPDLSLSLEGNVSYAFSRAIKPEPYIENCEKDTMNFHMGVSNFVGFNHVNLEPQYGNLQDGTVKVSSSDQKQAAGRVVKMEPSEVPSEEYLNRPAVRTPNIEFEKNKPAPHHIEVPLSMVEAVDLNSVTLSVEKNVVEVDGPAITVNTNINTSQNTCVALASTVKPASDESCKTEETLDATCNVQDEEGSDMKAVDVNVDSLISDVIENLVGTVTSDDAYLASDPFHQSVGSVALAGMSEGSAEMDCSDGERHTSSKLNAADNLHLDSMGESLGDDKKQGSMDLSSKIQEHYDELPYDSPHGLNVARDVLAYGAGVGKYKDSELRDVIPHEAVEASCKGGENVDNKMAAGSTAPVDVAVKMSSTLVTTYHESYDARTSCIDESYDGNLFNDKNDTGSSLTTDLPESSGGRVPTILRSTRLLKPPQKVNRKEKGPSMKSKSIGSPSSKVVKTSKGDASIQQVNAKEVDVPTKNPVSLGTDSDTSGLADQHVDDGGKCSQIRMVSSSGTNKLSSGKKSSISARLVFSQTDRGGLMDKSHRRERSHSRGSRGERCDDRPLKYGSNDQDQPVWKHYSDTMNTRRDGNYLSAYSRDSGHRYGPKFNDSKGYRFPRRGNGHDVPLRIAVDDSGRSAGRIIRRFMDDEPPHLFHFPYRRRSPGIHDGPSLGVQGSEGPSRDVSPSRYIGRHVSNILSDHEKIMRGLPNEMMDPFLYSDPCDQYEGAENHSMWRERSLSPTQRRGPPIHLPLPRARSPYQCLQPRRSPDIIYEGHPELIQQRSPPVVKIDQLRTPPRRLCFSEYAMVRNGLPPYSRIAGDLPGDIREMQPMRELDLPRPSRGSQRKIERFELSDQQENAEEDYFGSLRYAQLPAQAEDELFERRYFDGKCDYYQPYGNCYPVGGEESITYPVDGPSRPIRFCSNREGFSDRGSIRNHPVMRMKNQLVSTGNNSRRRPEREDFRNRGPPHGFNDIRLKRRRV